MKRAIVLGMSMLFVATVAMARPQGPSRSMNKNMKRGHKSLVWEYCTNVKPDSPNCQEVRKLREEYKAKMKELRKKIRQEVADYCKGEKASENPEFCARVKARRNRARGKGTGMPRQMPPGSGK